MMEARGVLGGIFAGIWGFILESWVCDGYKRGAARAWEGRGGEVGLLISKVLSWGGGWRGLARGWGWDGVEFGPEAGEATVWRLTFYGGGDPRIDIPSWFSLSHLNK